MAVYRRVRQVVSSWEFCRSGAKPAIAFRSTSKGTPNAPFVESEVKPWSGEVQTMLVACASKNRFPAIAPTLNNPVVIDHVTVKYSSSGKFHVKLIVMVCSLCPVCIIRWLKALIGCLLNFDSLWLMTTSLVKYSSFHLGCHDSVIGMARVFLTGHFKCKDRWLWNRTWPQRHLKCTTDQLVSKVNINFTFLLVIDVVKFDLIQVSHRRKV